MPIAQLRPNDRYAIVGKTGSGKTSLGMVIAGTFAQILPEPWEVWWIDTKGDPSDIASLRRWGFRNAASAADQRNAQIKNALYFLIRSEGKNRKERQESVVNQAQDRFAEAFRRRHVVVVVDEYTQVVPGQRDAGADLLDIFTRGRGTNVGIIGMTQEPVFVPRQLLSQATHLVLFSLSYQQDIDYIRRFYREYVPPQKVGDIHGFYWAWIDGNGEFTFYPNQKIWYQDLNVVVPKQPAPA